MNAGTPVSALLADARGRLPTEARREAELLLAHVLHQSRSWLYAHDDALIDAEARQRFVALVDARATGVPVAHLVGHRGFWTLDLEVGPATLIPRPETELLVEAALEHLPPGRAARVLDLGTGSGAIALAIAAERPDAQVTATDASADALQIARRNAERHRLRVEFVHGDWFAPLAGRRFDLIVSNPPYIADDDPHLEQGDLRFEPRTALAAGADGLAAIRVIVADAPAHLEVGGWLLLEHGWEQGRAVRELLRAHGFDAVGSLRDLEARERVSLGRHLHDAPTARVDPAPAQPAP